MRNKSEVTNKFMEYMKFAEKQTGRAIKVIQSDNDKEYYNTTMDSILKESGIRHRLTTPHTPEQNGVAERKNRTLVESAMYDDSIRTVAVILGRGRLDGELY